MELDNGGSVSKAPENELPAVHTCHLLENTGHGSLVIGSTLLQVTENTTLTIFLFWPPFPFTPGEGGGSNDPDLFY